MDNNQTNLLDSIYQMQQDAQKVGLCSMPFRVLYDRVAELIEDNEHLKSECERLMSIR